MLGFGTRGGPVKARGGSPARRPAGGAVEAVPGGGEQLERHRVPLGAGGGGGGRDRVQAGGHQERAKAPVRAVGAGRVPPATASNGCRGWVKAARSIERSSRWARGSPASGRGRMARCAASTRGGGRKQAARTRRSTRSSKRATHQAVARSRGRGLVRRRAMPHSTSRSAPVSALRRSSSSRRSSTAATANGMLADHVVRTPREWHPAQVAVNDDFSTPPVQGADWTSPVRRADWTSAVRRADWTSAVQ
jgi:hypothetical protein